MKEKIRETIKNKSVEFKYNKKSDAICSAFSLNSKKNKDVFVKDEIKIKIVGEINKIEVNGLIGVEVFAKGWKNGKQLGFGKDGSVEIERFRIFNPPILVDDESGDIIVENEYLDIKTNTTVKEVRRLKEDPERAIKEVIAHNIKLVGKEDAEIEKGKVGNTTSTFYPDPDAESTSVDGYVRSDQLPGVSWASIHAETTITNTGGLGGAFPSTATSDYPGIGVYGYNSNTRWVLSRAFFLFDTSSIPDTDSIDSATFSFYITGKENSDNDGEDFFNVIQTSPASNTDLVAGDFDQCGAVSNPTEGATRVDMGSLSTSAYNDWTLDATGRGWIDKSGITKLGLREGHDILNSTPSVSNSGNQIQGRFADYTGTSSDPKLVVVHSAGGATFIPKIMMS
jgi:hypothetical protein